MKYQTRRRKKKVKRKRQSRIHRGGNGEEDKDMLRKRMLIGLSEKLREKIQEIEAMRIQKIKDLANSFLDKIKNENEDLFELLKNLGKENALGMSKEERLNIIQNVYDAWINKDPTKIVWLIRSSWFKGETPDIIKFFSNYWVLQYLADPLPTSQYGPISSERFPISTYLWKDEKHGGEVVGFLTKSEREEELETLRTGVIETYKEWENEHPGLSDWKQFWINQKLWKTWPSKAPWLTFLINQNPKIDMNNSSRWARPQKQLEARIELLRCDYLNNGEICTNPAGELVTPVTSGRQAEEETKEEEEYASTGQLSDEFAVESTKKQPIPVPSVAPPAAPPLAKEYPVQSFDDEFKSLGQTWWGGGRRSRRKRRTRRRKRKRTRHRKR